MKVFIFYKNIKISIIIKQMRIIEQRNIISNYKVKGDTVLCYFHY